ncbi:iron chelate uptake ABC transporter family permease subunit [Donghicola eburneus]|uniref:Enterobactin ABC transporter permease n=1 Tax=Donghicola eburneus TaxID=393278 RepID=A0A1M4N0J1_9RHOB|nr:iron chelate uptake ABC transporter family permease subunit [Donghicola eburneus]SCM67528.1 enterobactin ABC transporter permease [Donghicola eburneus]SFQ06585.1 iron complex transport system permease protein [Donghicola eburneus]
MAKIRFLCLIAVFFGVCALFLLWQLRDPKALILSLRLTKLGALVVVGAAVGAATVVFQTITANRLLTPGIVGFDALYIFLQTMLVMTLGGTGYATLPQLGQFGAEIVTMVVTALLLFGLMLRRGTEDMLRLILTGVILGVLLRGLAGLAQRLLDPSEFAIVQGASFASFGGVDKTQLWIAMVLLAVTLLFAMRLSRQLDIVALGRTTARSLGQEYDRVVLASLALVALLVAVSTALVGPVTFLGLLAASLAYAFVPTWRHIYLIPAAALIGASILIFGQFVFERLLGLQSTLAVIVEFAGGLLFLALVLRRSPR